MLLNAQQPLGLYGTFWGNNATPVHRWYPYVEAFSAQLVTELTSDCSKVNTFYDPFAGCGTSLRVAASRGMRTFYSEVNPFLRQLIRVKTRSNITISQIVTAKNTLTFLEKIVEQSELSLPTDAIKWYQDCFQPSRPYFNAEGLISLHTIRRTIAENLDENDFCYALAQIGLGAIVVNCSNLIRAGDVRFRRPDEMHLITDPKSAYIAKLSEFCDDLPFLHVDGHVDLLSDSALEKPALTNEIDLIVTSPPYLNGTNYFRNTKLELWVTNLLQHQDGLRDLRLNLLASGISELSSSRTRLNTDDLPASVHALRKRLDETSYDRRIPQLAESYFADSLTWLGNAFQLLKPGGEAFVDIGDSNFAGVHVQTDVLLAELAHQAGFQIIDARNVRQRRSRNGTQLSQILLHFKKPLRSRKRLSTGSLLSSFTKAAATFHVQLPYRELPFSKRNWGDSRHSLCSYQGKIKPAIAHFLIKQFTSKNEVVLDPMSGSGTVPLEAHLQNRQAFAIDVQPLGAALSYSKVETGRWDAVWKLCDDLDSWLKNKDPSLDVVKYKNFGFNRSLSEFYEAQTLNEVISARSFFSQNPDTWESAIVKCAVSHLLHGNRPYALSRRSHPVTPFAPTGPYEYRSLIPRLRAKISLVQNKTSSGSYAGWAALGDFLTVEPPQKAHAIITSPPFAGSTRFYMANWLRLWFLGWDAADFRNVGKFIETKQLKSMSVYKEAFSRFNHFLAKGGIVIMHLGVNNKFDMAKELIPLAKDVFDVAYCFEENVASNETFGVGDQGATRTHSFLFLSQR